MSDGDDARATVDLRLARALLRVVRETAASIDLGVGLAAAAGGLAAAGADVVPGTEWLVLQATGPSAGDVTVVGAHGAWAAGLGDMTWPVSGTVAGSALPGGRAVEWVRGADDAVEHRPLDGGIMGAFRAMSIPSMPPALLVAFRPDSTPFSPAEARGLDQYAAIVAGAALHPPPPAVARDAALHHAVHDMRAPITVIAGYIEMIEEGVLGTAPPAWTRPIEQIHGQVDRLTRIINRLIEGP